MTPKTFFVLFIKIIGVYLLIESITVALGFLSSLPYFIDEDATFHSIVASVLITFTVLSMYVFVVYLCIYRTEDIVIKLQLDKGFGEEKVRILFNQRNMLSIVVYLVGGVMLADAIPHFCKQIFDYYQQRYVHEYFTQNPSTKYVVYHAIKMGIAFCLIKENKRIVSFLERGSES